MGQTWHVARIAVAALLAAAAVIGPWPPPSSATAARAATTSCTGRPPQAARTMSRSMGHNGFHRTYRLRVPHGYDPRRPTPVVLLFHGQGSYGIIDLLYTDYGATADRNGFLVVVPDAAYPTWNHWQIDPPPDTPPSGTTDVDPRVDDTGFVEALLDRVADRFCVDTHRVFATGFSSGAFMTSYLACRLPHRIAAVVTVAGSVYYDERQCGTGRAVPVLAFHGTADRNVPFDDQRWGAAGPNDGVVPNLRRWALRRNGCTSATTVGQLTAAVSTRTWSCPRGQCVRLARIQGGGHAWPGAAYRGPLVDPTDHHVSATTMGWQFFAHHPLP